MVKRSFMVQLWRIQQSYILLALLIWGVLITFTAWPILSPVWQDILGRFGVPLSAPGAVAVGLLVIFFGVYVVLYTFGVVYDKYLKLWREQLDVTYERNPYTREKLMVKEILMWRHMFLPVLKVAAPTDPAAKKEIEFVEKWIGTVLASDAVIRKAVGDSERAIESGSTNTA
ncbi:MAG: hypothetical protein A3K59_02155 [Euryarchaeota archaeon RBG_19FT_COMBO_69_17]|nr:MAG: hypothetical protein A3K59_02155 [Euryarchaeota archaeon RBG_19FT_COMBO_69_17]